MKKTSKPWDPTLTSESSLFIDKCNPVGIKQKLRYWFALWFGGKYTEPGVNGYWRFYPTIIIRIRYHYYNLKYWILIKLGKL